MASNNSSMMYPDILFDQIFDYFSWLLFLISTILFCLLFWTILNKSPKEMKVYRWYLMGNYSMMFVIDIIVGLVHPRIVAPYWALIFGGIMNYSGSDIFDRVLICVVLFIFGMYTYLVTLMSIFRYGQTIGNKTIVRVLSKPKYLLIHLVIYFIFISIISIPFVEGMVNGDEIKDLYRDQFPDIYERIQNKTLDGFKNIPLISMFTVAIFIVTAFSIGFICILLTYKSLVRLKSHTTAKTYTLYRKLINIIVLEFLIYAVSVIPALITAIAVSFQFIYSNVLAAFAVFVVYMLPAATVCVPLVYIDHYRRAVKKLIYKILRIQPNETTVYSINNQKTDPVFMIRRRTVFLPNNQANQLVTGNDINRSVRLNV